MSLWDSLVGTVTDVLGGAADFITGTGKGVADAVSSLDFEILNDVTGLPQISMDNINIPQISFPTDNLSNLYEQGYKLFTGLGDYGDSNLLASPLVEGAKYPMTQGASMFSDLGLGGVGDFINSYGKYLYPAAKALGTAYTGGQEAKDYMAYQQPLMSLSAEHQQKYRDMMDPQKRALAQARIRRNMQGEIQPMLDRITDRAFMSARRRGTPIGASTVGNYQGGLLSDMVSKAYGDIYNYASAADTQNVKDQMNMLTGQYKALQGSPQFQPTYISAANYNPWTSIFKALV